MKTNQYDYALNKTYRDDVMRHTDRRRLVRQVTRQAMPRTIAAALYALWLSLFR
jgi:hypothetical protein